MSQRADAPRNRLTPCEPGSAKAHRAQLLADARRLGCDCQPTIRVPMFWQGRLIGMPEVSHQDQCATVTTFYVSASAGRRTYRRRYRRRHLPD
jgi:hypothetical protein